MPVAARKYEDGGRGGGWGEGTREVRAEGGGEGGVGGAGAGGRARHLLQLLVQLDVYASRASSAYRRAHLARVGAERVQEARFGMNGLNLHRHRREARVQHVCGGLGLG